MTKSWTRKDHINNILKTLPQKSGVYQHFDKNGTILYVGKAKNLRNRVRSYFTGKHEYGKTRILVSLITDIKYIVVDTEIDALLLENTLIKKYKPRFNVMLKDDKTYPWIKITNERFPRVISTRIVAKDGAKYFGPYASVKMMYTILDLVKQLHPLRTCNYNLSEENIDKKKFKVCLEFHIGNCNGPCEGKQEEYEYNKYILNVESIIKGNIKAVIGRLNSVMREFAKEQKYEEAQAVKEKLDTLKNYQSRSTVVHPTIDNVEVFTILSDVDSGYINYVKIISGAIIQGHTLELKKKLEESDEELLALGIIELRDRFKSNCKEIFTNIPVDLQLEGTKFFVPQKGDKKSLVELSERNAKYYRLEQLKRIQTVDPERHSNRILETIKKDLRLSELPRHIECFDNSNFQGSNAVAACVVFKNAKPSKKDYRHFNIKTVVGPDDFASMREVVYRRYKRLIEEDQPLPQLIIVDGGKGQLSSALQSIDELGLRGQVSIVGIAKKLEEIFFPGDPVPLYIDKRSESLKVIQHLRNEAHRFGITHHRNKRSKGAIRSELDEIQGIGPKTQQALIRKFKSVKRIKEASKQELEEVIGISKGHLVFQHFND